MDRIEQLQIIAEYLGLSNVVTELKAIDFRSKQENPTLMLPLVGEFSSGKTTLINSLTDSKKLETATKPT
ncbi:MAG: septin family protein, partial [Bacteroidaceae bacterium]|nr:septin family protein [Bacteroidaceae bacterium]